MVPVNERQACRTCGGNLPENSRVCPVCGDRTPGPIADKVGQVFVGLMLLLIVAVVLYSAYKMTNSIL